MFRGYRYFPDEEVFKAKAITNATFLYPDSLYRRRRSDQTLSRLMSLGTFKFVDIRYRQANQPDSGGYGRLNSADPHDAGAQKVVAGGAADERFQHLHRAGLCRAVSQPLRPTRRRAAAD